MIFARVLIFNQYYDIQDALDPEVNSDDASLFLNGMLGKTTFHEAHDFQIT